MEITHNTIALESKRPHQAAENLYLPSRLEIKTLLGVLLAASLAFWSLRWHPLTYDVGIHVEAFLKANSALRTQIMPGIIPVQLLSYGLLSFFPPDPLKIVSGFFLAGWIGFLVLALSSAIWSLRFLKMPWIGFLLVLILGNLPPYHFLLFASQPYEIGMNLILASLFLNFSSFPKTSICLSVLGFLVHPNLIVMSLISGGATLFRNPKYFALFSALLFLSLIFYLGTARW